MFVAIIAPVAKKSLKLFAVIAFAVALSCAFYYIPFLSKNIPSGLAISICAVAAAVLGALLFPKSEEAENE